MGILPVYNHVVWTEEFTNNIFQGSHSCIQIIHPPVSRGISGQLENLYSIERPCKGVETDVRNM
jgi:hypothetical protein